MRGRSLAFYLWGFCVLSNHRARRWRFDSTFFTASVFPAFCGSDNLQLHHKLTACCFVVIPTFILYKNRACGALIFGLSHTSLETGSRPTGSLEERNVNSPTGCWQSNSFPLKNPPCEYFGCKLWSFVMHLRHRLAYKHLPFGSLRCSETEQNYSIIHWTSK